jgi:hypothetical protein
MLNINFLNLLAAGRKMTVAGLEPKTVLCAYIYLLLHVVLVFRWNEAIASTESEWGHF